MSDPVRSRTTHTIRSQFSKETEVARVVRPRAKRCRTPDVCADVRFDGWPMSGRSIAHLVVIVGGGKARGAPFLAFFARSGSRAICNGEGLVLMRPEVESSS